MLEQYIEESKYIVVLTGAGMSTESNLPDFRGENGLWRNKKPSKVGSTFSLRFHKKDFYEFYRERIQGLQEVQPNAGHDILAKWEKEGKVKAIITQNVDRLHHKAGSQNIYELHGNLATLRCTKCHTEYPATRYLEKEGQICVCGKFIRTNVVLFGENLPQDQLDGARAELQKADLLIILGTSLQVSPANTFAKVAKKQGAKVVIVNLEETIKDKFADEVVNGIKISEVLVATDKKLQKK